MDHKSSIFGSGTYLRMLLDVLPWEPKCDVLPWRPDAQKGGYIQLMTMGTICEENESDWSQNVQLNSNNCSVTKHTCTCIIQDRGLGTGLGLDIHL